MAEEWTPTAKGEHLRGRRTRNTAPEVALRRALHQRGLRFRLHRAVAPRCTPDFVLPRYHLAVFVDGCFWHGCPTHSPQQFRGPNAELWARKLSANRERDKRNDRVVTDAGWRVIRVWECEIKSDVEVAADKLQTAALGGSG
ncbi:very short patch repair endonuclease [Lentzea albida]|uniref:T/G mismatch-specific endonuclease n=1 Tax=Lentzea albida TaxID=65499 RepID=A0A1H9BQN0_9PSEU|nr:very short patch repair endonuclease [Lentzea albida]SEP91107.1 T/G mismatch-specific endonuclease [Lentzea albida]